MNYSRLLGTTTTLGAASTSVKKCVSPALTVVMFLACAAAVASESPPTGIPMSLPQYAFEPQVEDYYPAASRSLKEQGTTKIKLCYDHQGRPIQLIVEESSSVARLDEAAVRWGKAVRIIPGLIDGQPYPGCVMVLVKFSLEKSQEPPDQSEDRLVLAPPIIVDVPPPPPPPPVRLVPLRGETG
jgi:protein TonB